MSPLLDTNDANQVRASDPRASAWVSANAGTGKTAVLVKRVLRLLLEGSGPEAILCLTYTKTAAAEMQNRLLQLLSSWATLPSDKLRAELVALLRREPNDEELHQARRLFARTLEAKGGLKIHTIHGFCERLLQRFPLEAEVTPHFAVLDEREQALMRREAFDAAVARAAEEKDTALGSALATLIALTAGEYFRQVVDAVVGKRSELARMMAYHDSRPEWAEAEGPALKRLFEVAEHTEDALIEAMADVLSNDEMDSAIAALAAHGTRKTDKAVEARLREAKTSKGEERAAAFAPVFLTDKNEPRERVVTAGFADEAPQVAAMLDVAQTAFANLTAKLMHLRVAEASAAVIVIADAVRSEYERRKRSEAALDYDDLIVKAQDLLFRSGAAAWVLYKIDGGVDHILVDEAQDTNPAQWTIIERLAEEFFAGASKRLRTLFAVGDEKQSIYSFQGANPARFGEVGRAFKRRAEALSLNWHEVPLNLSFRSTAPILEAVDRVFAEPPAANGLTWIEGTAIHHEVFREHDAGSVELWEIEADERSDPVDAFEPWADETAGARSVDRLCQRIAATIKGWIDKEELPAQGRKVRAGDILILVRRRDPFTTPMIRELKRLNVPVAGADRMKLLDQLAVQDLVALADFLLMPEDDLALAVTLKSPLFGFDDDALFALAHKRGSQSLWSALKDKAEGDDRFAQAAQQLSHWLSRVDFQPPYEFYSELLGADGQRLRKAMLSRLGPEAAEAIDEFLDVALAFDREAAPSLQGFVNRIRSGEAEIKRDMEQGRDEVRIITVHGAKGLQAPIVFLPDTCMGPRAQNPRLFSLPRAGEPEEEIGHIAWAPPGHSGVIGLADAKLQSDRADREEYHRLLYVAMTRAQDRLYVCGWRGVNSGDQKSWYNLINSALGCRMTEHDGPEGKKLRRMESQQKKSVERSHGAKEKQADLTLPDWALAPAPPERARPKLAPSRLALGLEGGVEALGPEQPPLGPLELSENGRFARGRLVHALLQYLPEVEAEHQERAARLFVAARGANLAEALREEIVAETLAIVRHADFAPLFQPGSIAEVPIVARIGDADLEGQIDRLVETEAGLLILDYKTNRPPPRTAEEVAPAYIAQLAAYRAALRKLYPERALRAALLWTDGPRLMEISSTSLDAAERRFSDRKCKP